MKLHSGSNRCHSQADYADMLGPMFFGDTPTFEEMIAAATEFESTFNTI